MRFFSGGWGGQSGLEEALWAGREVVQRKIHWLRRSGKLAHPAASAGLGVAFRGVCTEITREVYSCINTLFNGKANS